MSFDLFYGARPEPEDEDCTHDETDHGCCLDCGKDISDEICNRAHERSEGMER